MIGVYQIECLNNNKKYIGVSKDIKRRWKQHRDLLFQGLHNSSDMQKDYNQYGENSFEFKVIKECEYAEAKSLEEQLIQKNQPEYNAYTNGKGNRHNSKNKTVQIENKILQTVKPYFTSELEDSKSFMMVDLFCLSEKSGISPTQILKHLGVDSYRGFSFIHCVNSPYVIGLLPTNEGIVVVFSRDNCICEDHYFMEDICMEQGVVCE